MCLVIILDDDNISTSFGSSTHSKDDQTSKNDSQTENTHKSITDNYKSIKKGVTESLKAQTLDQRSVQIVNEEVKLKGDTTMAATDAATTNTSTVAATDAVTLNTATAVKPIAKKIMLNRQQRVMSDEGETNVGFYQTASNDLKTIANGNENLGTFQETSADNTNQTEQNNEITFTGLGRERRFASLVNALFKA